MKLYFIHGSGSNSVVWEGLLRSFPNAVAIDLPGHPNGQLCESVSEYAAHLSQVIANENEPVVVVGHSLGGGIALQLALDYPDLLSAVVLVGSGARLRVLPSLLENLEHRVSNKDDSLPPEVFAMNGLIAEPYRTKINSVITENGAAVLLSDLKACDQFDVMDRIDEIQMPLQLICGDRDMMTPPKYSEHLASKVDDAKCSIVKGATHMVMAEQAEVVAKLIQEFVSWVKLEIGNKNS